MIKNRKKSHLQKKFLLFKSFFTRRKGRTPHESDTI